MLQMHGPLLKLKKQKKCLDQNLNKFKDQQHNKDFLKEY